jgi:hypothetical protein
LVPYQAKVPVRAKIYMCKNSTLQKKIPACLPEKLANPTTDFYAIPGLQGIAGIAASITLSIA